MSTYKLREIKREIRVLGLATIKANLHDYYAVGVIFRGKHWIDGVIKSTVRGPDLTEGVSRMISGSNHYPQIRVLLTARRLLEDGATIDTLRLSIDTKRPVIGLGFGENRFTGDHWLKIVSLEEFEAHAIGLDRTQVAKVLTTASRDKGLPEVLRVAELVVKSYSSNRT